MSDAAAWEPIEALLSAGATAGFSGISKNQLHRWQREGVLPRPRQRGLGRGRGSEVLYPTGSSEQLVALCEQLERKRDLIEATWVLWWRGYAVAEAAVRRLLRAKVTQLQSLKALHARGGTASLIDETNRGRLTGPIRLMRKSAGRDDFPKVVEQLLGFGLGESPVAQGDNANVVAKALDSKESGTAIQGQMRITSAAYDPDRLGDALEAASIEELEASRDALRAVFSLPEALTELLESVTGLATEIEFRIPIRWPSLEEGLYLVLLILSVRREPWAEEAAESFASLVRAVGEGLVPAADALDREFPFRREEPTHAR